MCGRYSLALRPSEVRAYLQNEHMPIYEAPEDDSDEAPRQSYNFAPGYSGIVYRADVPYYGAGSQSHHQGEAEAEVEAPDAALDKATEEEQGEVRYKLQTMRWGLIPFWTKRNPDYGSLTKTINCRDDSLMEKKGMWTTMKQKKRCIVVAQGFYEWLKKGPKEKVPHYVKRKDGQLMCMAGLWDCVQYEGSEDKTWTYTIITTDSNKQLKFLHDRMPVILENGSEEMRTWLDPKRSTWSKDLQSLLKPLKGELEVYPVSKEVGKVGNNSPRFIIPVASTENKSNIANFFAKGASKEESNISKDGAATYIIKSGDQMDVSKERLTSFALEEGENRETVDHEGTEDNAPLPIPKSETKKPYKRELDDNSDGEPPHKVSRTSISPPKQKASSTPTGRTKSATSNNVANSKKSTAKEKGNQKITTFFGK